VWEWILPQKEKESPFALPGFSEWRGKAIQRFLGNGSVSNVGYPQFNVY
jgi:hypothetical protein